MKIISLPLARPLSSLVLVTLVGCASPTFKLVKKDAPLDHYNRVFALPFEDDPRQALVKVKRELEREGYPVTVLDEKSEIKDSQGTAFLISSKGHLLTCNHVLSSATLATVWMAGKQVHVKVVKIDEKLDLAILLLPEGASQNLEPLPFYVESRPIIGEEVFAIGFPLAKLLGSRPRLSKGLVSAEAGFKDNEDQVQISAEIQPGNSGGPLMDDRGAIIGIIQQSINPMRVYSDSGTLPQNINFALKNEKVLTFLKEADIPIIKATTNWKRPFDMVQKSVFKIQAGKALPDAELKNILFCTIQYSYLWDIVFRFNAFHLTFYDYASGDMLFTAGQYRDNPLLSMDTVVQRTIREVVKNLKPAQVDTEKVVAVDSSGSSPGK